MTIRSIICATLALLPLRFAESQSPAAPSGALLGYATENVAPQRALEKKFQDRISAANIRANMRRLSARPHHVGSPYDKDNAEWILAQFKAWGFDARIERFDVLFPTPKIRVLEMTKPTHFTASLREPAVAGDPTSSQSAEQLPPTMRIRPTAM